MKKISKNFLNIFPKNFYLNSYDFRGFLQNFFKLFGYQKCFHKLTKIFFQKFTIFPKIFNLVVNWKFTLRRFFDIKHVTIF